MILLWIPIDGLALLSLHSLERVIWSAEAGYLFAICIYFGWRGVLLSFVAAGLSNFFWKQIDYGPVFEITSQSPADVTITSTFLLVAIVGVVTMVFHRFFRSLPSNKAYIQVVPAMIAALIASFLMAYSVFGVWRVLEGVNIEYTGLTPPMLAMASFAGIVSLSGMFCLSFAHFNLEKQLGWPRKLVLSRCSEPNNIPSYLLFLVVVQLVVAGLFFAGNSSDNDIWHMMAGLIIVAGVMVISIRYSELQTAIAGAVLVSLLAIMEHSSLGNSVSDSIEIFMPLLAISVYMLRLIPQMLHEQVRLRQRADSDPLTHLLNRRGFTAVANIELERAYRYKRPLAVLILDIDHFKNVNDTHGHACGDVVIKLVARCMLRGLRSEAIAGRWGGEEFVVILPESDDEAARVCAERIRQLIGNEKAQFETGSVNVTASAGVAMAESGETLEQILNRADQALYRAKQQGRDRVIVAPKPVTANES
ncbi:GGDEF domain-containing protein [Neiella holothuriorum]|nr:GGDEF domain-containing protein [Neiella holothuriorum]